MLDKTGSGVHERLAETVRAIVAKHPDGRPDRIDGDLREAGLTSLDMVKLVLAIEDGFGLTLDADDMHPDNFATLDAMVALVAHKKAA
jgi:acyl carrier protein